MVFCSPQQQILWWNPPQLNHPFMFHLGPKRQGARSDRNAPSTRPRCGAAPGRASRRNRSMLHRERTPGTLEAYTKPCVCVCVFMRYQYVHGYVYIYIYIITQQGDTKMVIHHRSWHDFFRLSALGEPTEESTSSDSAGHPTSNREYHKPCISDDEKFEIASLMAEIQVWSGFWCRL